MTYNEYKRVRTTKQLKNIDAKAVNASVVTDFSLDFDGIDEYVEAPHSAVFNTGTGVFTYSWWMKKPTGSTGNQCFFTKRNPIGGAGSFAYFNGTTGIVRLGFGTTAGQYNDFTPSVTLDDNNWHHIVFVRTGSDSMELYIDGAFEGNATGITAVNADNINPLELGSITSTSGKLNYYIGKITAFSFWDTDLNLSEIQEIYNSGNPTNLLVHSQETNMHAWYLPKQTYPTVQDIKNGNDGTMYNMETGDITNDVP